MKSGLAQMAKGGVVMDVTNAEQAKIAEEAGVSPGGAGRAGLSPRRDGAGWSKRISLRRPG